MASTDPFGSGGMIKNQGGSAFVDSSGRLASYCYASLANTPAATPTDMLVIQGSASKIVKIRRIQVGGIAGTAGNLRLALIRRSTANTSGTSTAPTPALYDPNTDAAATAVLTLYTANPTVGTSVATIKVSRVFLNVTTALTEKVDMIGGVFGMRPITLTGASDFLAINGDGATVPSSGVLDFNIEWTEE